MPPSPEVMPHGTFSEAVTNLLALRCAPRSWTRPGPRDAAAAPTVQTTRASPEPFAITPIGNGFSPSLRRIFITRSADFGRTMIV